MVYRKSKKWRYVEIHDNNQEIKKLCYLAILTSECNSRKITYIVKSTKMQKRQTLRNGFALIEKTISQKI
jgi:hypothetical protein